MLSTCNAPSAASSLRRWTSAGRPAASRTALSTWQNLVTLRPRPCLSQLTRSVSDEGPFLFNPTTHSHSSGTIASLCSGWPPVYFFGFRDFAHVELGSNSFTCLVKSKPVLQEVSCTVILPLLVSVLCILYHQCTCGPSSYCIKNIHVTLIWMDRLAQGWEVWISLKSHMIHN